MLHFSFLFLPAVDGLSQVPKILFAVFALMVTMALIFHATPTVAASLGGLIAANAAGVDGVVIYAYQQPGAWLGVPCVILAALANTIKQLFIVFQE